MSEELRRRIRLVLPAFIRLLVIAAASTAVGAGFGVETGLWTALLTIGLFFALHLHYLSLSFFDRQVLSVLAPTVKAEMGMNNSQLANVMAAFTLSYSIMFLLGGRFLDWVGTRRGMLLCVSLWTVASAAHAAARNVWHLGVYRFLLGVGEGAPEDLAECMAQVPAVRSVTRADGQLKIETHRLQDGLMGALDVTNQADVRITSLEILEPNLESVFLHLTGKKLRQ